MCVCVSHCMCVCVCVCVCVCRSGLWLFGLLILLLGIACLVSEMFPVWLLDLVDEMIDLIITFIIPVSVLSLNTTKGISISAVGSILEGRVHFSSISSPSSKMLDKDFGSFS